MKPVYVCTGGCGGKVSAEDHAAGKTTCATPGCAKEGQPLEAHQECEECGAVISLAEAPIHKH